MPEQEVTLRVDVPDGCRFDVAERIDPYGTEEQSQTWSIRFKPIHITPRYRPYTPEEAVRLLGERIVDEHGNDGFIGAIKKYGVGVHWNLNGGETFELFYQDLLKFCTHNGSPCGVEVEE